MKVLKVLSLVAFLAPGISFAEGTDHSAAAHEGTKKEEVKAVEPTAQHPAAHTDAAPAAHDSAAATVKPTVAAEEKTDKKAFCAKNQEEATKKCNTWLGHQKNQHKDKLVDSSCSAPAAATKADKGCKVGSQVSHGEVKFHK